MLILVFLWSLSATAVPLVLPTDGCSQTPLYQKTNFFPIDMASQFQGLEKVQPALLANFNYKSETAGDPLSCSGSYSSRNGHFSSSFHCLQNCLVASGHYVKIRNKGLVRTDKPFPTRCPISSPDGMKEMKILAAGDCYSRDTELCSGDSDFVIGRVEGKKTNCVQVRWQDPKVGEKVISIGTPVETLGRRYNSDGRRPYFSFGQVISHSTEYCDEIWIENGKERIEKKFLKNPAIGFVRMSADATFGSSGGPVVDANGEVIGLNAGGTVNDVRECVGGTHFAPMSKILEKAKAKMLTEDFNSAFNCKGQ